MLKLNEIFLFNINLYLVKIRRGLRYSNNKLGTTYFDIEVILQNILNVSPC